MSSQEHRVSLRLLRISQERRLSFRLLRIAIEVLVEQAWLSLTTYANFAEGPKLGHHGRRLMRTESRCAYSSIRDLKICKHFD